MVSNIESHNGNTENARTAITELTPTNESEREELTRELVSEGVYHVVVEGGFHMQALTDAEADFITELLIEDGITGLEEFNKRINAYNTA